MKTVGLCFLLVLAAVLSGCAIPMAVAPLPTDDFGPKPKDPGRVIAAWLNARSISMSRGPCTAGELTMSEPTKTAFVSLTGRKAGWQVVLGPENSRMVDYTEVAYTRVIINRDRVISVVASSFPL
ncbi:MAG: hypothetical protein P4L99_12460 [Chthoniobacter sp.]|nr:hypothetical protein [Chthoniobacter sp.]